MWVAPGPEQGPKDGDPDPSEHSKLEPASLEWNAKVGVASLVGPDGPLSIVVWGGVPSTVAGPPKAASPFGVPTPVGPS